VSNLPVEITTFIGRQSAVADIKSILSEGRLITLTGIGGVGKTRLAVETARRISGGFADGVSFVPLADIASPEMVPMAVMREIGVRTQQNDVQGALVEYLQSRRLLLVLDNCEHVIDGAAQLAASLVRACPGLRIIATSRESMRIGGEYVYAVQPLATPGDDPGGPEALSLVESVQLFAERARTVAPRFTLTKENQQAVVQLCRSLDGLPLAIELAAVRMGSLPLVELVAQSHGHFTLLSRGSRAVAPRHQTLRAAVDWSFDLCTETERDVWARLATFSGGFDVAGGVAVCADLGLAEAELIDVVGGLVEKSIVARQDVDGVVRYSMLHTIREYGREKLRASGDDVLVKLAHLQHFLELAAETDRHWFGRGQAELFARLRAEQSNVRTALEFALSPDGDARGGLRLASDLWPFWFATGQQRESKHWIDLLLDQDLGPSVERAKALWVSGFFAILIGDMSAAYELLTRCRVAASLAGATEVLAHTAYAEGLLALAGREVTGSVDASISGEELDPNDPGAVALRVLGTIDLGYAHCLGGDLDRAAELFNTCKTLCDAQGELLLRSWSVTFLGLVEVLRKRPTEAIELLRQSIRVKRDFDDLLGMGLAVEFLAWAHTLAGSFDNAAVLFGSGERFWGPLGTYLVGFETLVDWHEEHSSAVREELGADEYGALFDKGDELSRAEAISWALGEDPAASRAARPATGIRSILTRREEQIARLISEGKSNREIAESLVISIRTVDSHVDNILRKLGVHSRSQVAAWVARLPGWGNS